MKDTLQQGESPEGNEIENAGRVQQVLDKNPELLSPIPCASPSEEPQVEEVITNEAELV